MRYDLFGFILETQLEFPILQITQKQNSDNIIKLSVLPYEKNSEHDLNDNKNNFVINFGINLIYIVPKPENPCNDITVFSDEEEKVRSSFLNIPMSLFLLRYKGFLLHISCIEKSGILIGFCGEKGVGKSTITFLLSKYYNLFSNDALYVQSEVNNIVGYRTNSFIRVAQNTFEMYGKENDFHKLNKNIMGKAYVFPEQMGLKSSKNNTGQLKRIYFLKRYNDITIKNIRIESFIKKKLYLFNNIIGAYHIKDELFLSMASWEAYTCLMNNVEFFEMNVPDNLDLTKSTIENKMSELFDFVSQK